ncbi:putative holin-like toxin [Sporosarcina luteola]
MVTYETMNILVQLGILHALWATAVIATIALFTKRK